MTETTARFNSIFRSANNSRKRYRVLKGSAGSGKSVNIAQDYIIKLMDPKNKGANLLVVRKVEESNKDSTYAELYGAITRICGDQASKIWNSTVNPLQLTCNVTGARIIFRGMNDARQRDKVKSINFPVGKLTWIWIVSTHAPAWGAIKHVRQLSFIGSFNSRARMGRDLSGLARAVTTCVSTHAPAWGAIRHSLNHVETHGVSTHAPAWGAM